MFEQLSIDPSFLFNDDITESLMRDTNGETGGGAEVLVARAGEAKAVYIDGEMVWKYDDLPRSRLMRIIEENTDGNLAAYAEAEAMYNRHTGKELYNSAFPEDPSNIVFKGEDFSPEDVEVTRVEVGDPGDLHKISETTGGVIVEVCTPEIDEQFVREFAPEGVDILQVNT